MSAYAGDCALLLLLYLSAEFDTIDQNILYTNASAKP